MKKAFEKNSQMPWHSNLSLTLDVHTEKNDYTQWLGSQFLLLKGIGGASAVVVNLGQKQSQRYPREQQMKHNSSLGLTSSFPEDLTLHLCPPGTDIVSQAVCLYVAKHHLSRSVTQAQFNERLAVTLLKLEESECVRG